MWLLSYYKFCKMANLLEMDFKQLFNIPRTVDTKPKLSLKSGLKRSKTFSVGDELCRKEVAQPHKRLSRKRSLKLSRSEISSPQDFRHVIHWPYQNWNVVVVVVYFRSRIVDIVCWEIKHIIWTVRLKSGYLCPCGSYEVLCVLTRKSE